MTRRRLPALPGDAFSIFREASALLQVDRGQAIADAVRRAADAVELLLQRTDAVVQAKALYYHQRVDNDDALALALTALADRIDDLHAAAARLEDTGAQR
jgi:hypothetical protein